MNHFELNFVGEANKLITSAKIEDWQRDLLVGIVEKLQTKEITYERFVSPELFFSFKVKDKVLVGKDFGIVKDIVIDCNFPYCIVESGAKLIYCDLELLKNVV